MTWAVLCRAAVGSAQGRQPGCPCPWCILPPSLCPTSSLDLGVPGTVAVVLRAACPLLVKTPPSLAPLLFQEGGTRIDPASHGPKIIN